MVMTEDHDAYCLRSNRVTITMLFDTTGRSLSAVRAQAPPDPRSRFRSPKRFERDRERGQALPDRKELENI